MELLKSFEYPLLNFTPTFLMQQSSFAHIMNFLKNESVPDLQVSLERVADKTSVAVYILLLMVADDRAPAECRPHLQKGCCTVMCEQVR